VFLLYATSTNSLAQAAFWRWKANCSRQRDSEQNCKYFPCVLNCRWWQ